MHDRYVTHRQSESESESESETQVKAHLCRGVAGSLGKSRVVARRSHDLMAMQRFDRAFGALCTNVVAAAAVVALALHVAFVDTFHAARLAPVLVGLLIVHVSRFRQIRLARETVIYLVFLLYMIVQLAWTSNIALAANTLLPAFSFLLVLVLFDSLIAYHDRRAAVQGMVLGAIASAALYTALVGFPFVYPQNFSYNAIALIYLTGLFFSLLYTKYGRLFGLAYLIAGVFFLHIVATTSIKTNLGLVLGVAIASLVYFRRTIAAARRNVLAIVVLAVAFFYALGTNDALMASIDRGVDRVSLGIEILRTREDIPGYTGFDKRSNWQAIGIDGWLRSPVFGNGVESFRSENGITSHSTPIDLLHNSGLIGFALFYAMLGSLGWRLVASDGGVRQFRYIVLSFLVCFSFITLSGTMHYNVFLAAFLAVSVAVLRGRTSDTGGVIAPTEDRR